MNSNVIAKKLELSLELVSIKTQEALVLKSRIAKAIPGGFVKQVCFNASKKGALIANDYYKQVVTLVGGDEGAYAPTTPVELMVFSIRMLETKLGVYSKIKNICLSSSNLELTKSQEVLMRRYIASGDLSGCQYVIYEASSLASKGLLEQPKRTTEIEITMPVDKVVELLSYKLTANGVPRDKDTKIEDINIYLATRFSKIEIVAGYCKYLKVSPDSELIKNIRRKL